MARRDLKLTDLERHAYEGFMGRYAAIDAQATLARERTQAEERTFAEALARRVGIDPAEIERWRVNVQTWTLERIPKTQG